MGVISKLAVKAAKDLAVKPHFQLNTPSFKNFFGKSQVVDANGNPLRVYHSTILHDKPLRTNTRPLGDVDAFDRFFAYKAFNRPEGMDAVGSWFSESYQNADGAMPGSGMYGDLTYPVYLRIEKPWKPKNFEDFLRTMHAKAGRKNYEEMNPKGRGSVGELRNWLSSEGYDGIRFSGGVDHPNSAPVWIALEPEQIKSAIGNRGTFDRKDPRIVYARGGRVSPFKVKR